MSQKAERLRRRTIGDDPIKPNDPPVTRPAAEPLGSLLWYRAEMGFPQAYHITFAGYGHRLPGSDQPHVDKHHNVYGEPFAPTSSAREARAAESLKHPVHVFDLPQMMGIETAIQEMADRYGWVIHAKAAKPNHLHVVITAPRDGAPLREAIKAVATKWLNANVGRRTWWAAGGSAKYLYEDDYFANAVTYVLDQREF